MSKAAKTVDQETHRQMAIGAVIIVAIIDFMVAGVTFGILYFMGISWMLALILAFVLSGLIALLAYQRFNDMVRLKPPPANQVAAAAVDTDTEAAEMPPVAGETSTRQDDTRP